MCFSAPVSFTASLVLIGIGSAAVKLVRNNQAWLLLGIAITPLFFALQQFLEGVVWLTINKPELAQVFLMSKIGYLFFATAFWPAWFPFAFYLAEKEKKAQYMILFIMILGIIFGIKSLALLTQYSVNQYQFSLHYFPSYIDNPVLGFGPVLYTALGTAPFLLSTLRYAKIYFGCLVIPLLLITAIDINYMISLWCFISALASTFLYVLIKQNLPMYLNQKVTEKSKIHEDL